MGGFLGSSTLGVPRYLHEMESMAVRLPGSFTWLLCVVVVTLAACGGEPAGIEGDALDQELQALLEAAAPFRGAGFFMLPESDDYAAIPQDPRNPLTAAKIQLGQFLLHETALAVDNVRPEGRETYSCSTCHIALAAFMPGR